MRRERRVKLLATLGPASASPDMMEKLFLAGVDVFRINMSHTSHELARKHHYNVRALSKRYRHPIGILADLQGPKFRVGQFSDEGIALPRGDIFHFDNEESDGDAKRVFLPHPQILQSVEPGHALLLDDGKIRMRVVERRSNGIAAEIEVGGKLSSRKGVSLPDTLLPITPITEKDEADLALALDIGMDWIALSFVQRAEDVEDAHSRIGGASAVLAKIEKPSAIDDIDGIIAAADGLMVARGDLGVEMPLEKVPGLQKKITRKSRAAGKPIVVATQMLESMISSPIPTRAEVSDVATAVFDGADAVMLSAESAVGQFPEEAINTMDRVAFEAERDKGYKALLHAVSNPPQPTPADAIAAAAHAIAETVKLSAIVCYTATGSTALRVARERPGLPVIGLTPVPETAHRLSLVWGLQTVLTSDPGDLKDMVQKACQIAWEHGYVKAGDGILITAGVPLGTPGATNMIRIAFVDENGEPISGA